MTLSALQAGDDTAWRAVLDPLLPRLRSFLQIRVGPDAADDVLSEILLEVWRRLPDYEDRGFPISAWIWRIAHSRAIDEQRRQARDMRSTAGAEQLLPIPDPHDLAEQLEQAEACAEIWARVDALPPHWSRVLRMRFAADMALSDIAERQHTTIGQIKALQHRALVHLRKCREPHDHT